MIIPQFIKFQLQKEHCHSPEKYLTIILVPQQNTATPVQNNQNNPKEKYFFIFFIFISITYIHTSIPISNSDPKIVNLSGDLKKRKAKRKAKKNKQNHRRKKRASLTRPELEKLNYVGSKPPSLSAQQSKPPNASLASFF